MHKIFFGSVLIILSFGANAQPAGYYNATSGKTGNELKEALHQLISDHVDYSYNQSKFIINYSDADPENPSNVILFYTQRSQSANTYGTGGDFINREHVWAKSHGNFADIRPMDGDAFNLRPADASVNEDRSNKDFGNVKPNGTQHPEATNCWYTASIWEPGDASKGQVARIIFYMDTRYEGTNGEMDLKAVNGFDTYPRPEHGDLATLLEWNRNYPPNDFERRRNERIFGIQQNRNPFIDHPEWADLIWAGKAANPIRIDKVSMSPQFPQKGQTVTIEAEVKLENPLDSVVFYWGKTHNSENHSVKMASQVNLYAASFQLVDFEPGELVYFKIVAANKSDTNMIHGSVEVARTVAPNQVTPVSTLQGTGISSPVVNQVITVAGRVIANFDNSFYIQQGNSPYSGLCVFGSLKTGKVGDSLVITGKVVEFNNLTELSDISYCYNFKNNKAIEPIEITASQIGEAYEGMLVKIRNVTFPEGGVTIPDENKSYTFSDASGSSVVFSRYSSRLLGKKLPRGITDVIGVVSQYQNTYQILPRDILDFSAGIDTEAPKITKVNLLDKEWLTIEFDEAVDKATAETINNYTFSDSIVVLSAFRYEEGNAVVLQVANMSKGKHLLFINGITDYSGNIMANESIEFESVYSGKNQVEANQVKVYQADTDQLVHVESSKPIFVVKVFDLSGRLVFEKKLNSREVILHEPMNRGLYVLRISDRNGLFSNHKIRIN